MPPNTGNGPATSTPEQALSKLLSAEQLAELAILVNKITKAMYNQIADCFHAPLPVNKQSRERLDKNARNPNVAERTGSIHEETGEEARARKLQARRERDLPDLRLQQLKQDAMDAFQPWSESVVSKIVDALNAKNGEESDVPTSVSDTAPPPDHNILGAHINTDHSDATLIKLYPPISTFLSSLPEKERIKILSAMLMLVLSQGHYVPNSRVLLLHMVSSLNLPFHVLVADEIKIAQGLLEAAKHMSAEEETRKRNEENQVSRRWKVGLAGVAGAVLIGVTGGLAAPLVAGAIGSVMGGLGLGATAAASLLGTLSSSGVIVGSLFGAYGYGMTSKMMDRYAKEVEDFAFIPMRRSKNRGQSVEDVLAEERRLRVTIGVSGWLTQKRDVINPWRAIGKQSEVFALRWELEALMEMGTSLEKMATSTAWAVASREVVKHTVFAGLMFAMWPITLLAASKIVDNPFNVAKNRADKAGLVLADAIINKSQGERPVTLIGYSVGARLIYSCLMSLAERRAFGLVESAVLIGAPAPSDASVWRAMKSVVAGRLVNIYSDKDYILAFLYRTSSIQFGVAGLEEVQDVQGVENVDVSSLVSGHLRYFNLVGSILESIGWEDIDVQEVQKEKIAIDMLDKEDEQKKAESIVEPSAGDQEKAEGTHTADPLLEGVAVNVVSKRERRPKLPGRKRTGKEVHGITVHDQEQQVIPMLHEQSFIKSKEQDLISFDEDPPEPEMGRSGSQQMPNFSSKGKSSAVPDKTQYVLDRPNEEHQGMDMSDQEDQGIVMHDLEIDDQGITMLEPIPLLDDGEPYSSQNTKAPVLRKGIQHDVNNTRKQRARDELGLGPR